MNRKGFLAVLTGLASLKSIGAGIYADGREIAGQAIIPPYLKPGDLIAISSPAGYMETREVLPAIKIIESWGFRVKTGKTIGSRHYGFGGTDAERRADLQDLIDDPDVKAIMCARGGYGLVRIIDQLKFSAAPARLKWMIGFSDITVLHSHLNRNFGIATIHSKMCNSFPESMEKADPEQAATILSIRDALTGVKTRFSLPGAPGNRNGIGRGNLVGGNLRTIETLTGSASDLVTRDKILFVEDTGEYLYSIDRMFWNLKRSGKLDQLKGLVVGGFRVKPDNPGEEFGKTIREIIMEKVSEFNYPVCFDFPVGHQKNNYAVKCGLIHELRVEDDQVILREIQMRTKGSLVSG